MALIKRSQKARRVTDSEKTQNISASLRLSFQVANLQMIGARERQEDSFAVINSMDVTQIIQNGLFAIVADGMGGMQDGKKISEAAVGAFINLFQSLDRSGNIPRQLREGVYGINTLLFGQFNGSGGTTAVAVMIYQSALYWVSVGDSAIFLKRNGGLFQLNQEHTYKNRLYLSELYEDSINRNRVEDDEDGARLSEFLGIDRLEEIDFNQKALRLRAEDVILLCSDGISGVLSREEITGALKMAPSEACAAMQAAILGRANPKQDNYTGVIINCRN